MKINKDTIRMARRIFQLCHTNNVLDNIKMEKVIHIISEEKPRHYLSLMEALRQFLIIEERKHQVTVTSTRELSESTKQLLTSKLSTKYGDHLSYSWQIDASLIAGLRIQVGDHVTDGSLKAKIETLQS